MKVSACFLAFITSLFILSSCNQGKNKSQQAEVNKNTGDEQCYRAVFEKDTADLKLVTAADGKITGDLVMDFGQLEPNSQETTTNQGMIAGEYRGDTLFVDYTYTSGPTSKTVYKNPLAFLKRGDQLILGVGEIETYVGRTYFVKDKPIDFEKGKYKLEATDCQNLRQRTKKPGQ